ncbi:oligosaccharide flippase family protein [Vibrio alginolyticus]|uniref:oligosaccharide flippase family protein n=1 Tax=Vibrio alginolyticus TaxID=663 RepID=UPI0024DF1053|nr:oligosaccharide flippase family protein [Vibrio alginolyticus]
MIKKVSKMLLGGGGGSIINTALYPILLSIYNPHQFGNYAIFFIPVSILIVLSSLKLELAIVSSKLNEVEEVFSSSIVISLCVALLCAPLILIYFHASTYELYFEYSLVAILYSISYVSIQFLISLFTVKNKTKASALLVFFQSCSIGVSQLISAWLFDCEQNLIIGVFISSIINIVLFLILTFNLSISKPRSIKSTLLLNKNIIIYGTLQSFLNTLSLSVVMLGIEKIYGSAALGIFNVCYKIMIIPCRIIVTSIRQIITNELSTRDINGQIKLVSLTVLTSSFSGVIAYILLFVLLDNYYVSLFLESKGWQGITKAVIPISFWMVSLLALSGPVSLLTVYKMNYVHFIFESINLVSRFIFIIIAMLLGCSLVEYLSIIASLTVLLSVYTIYYVIRKIKKIH